MPDLGPPLTWIAAPMPAGDRLFISGLGAFNVSTFYSLSTDPAAKEKERVAWSKSGEHRRSSRVKRTWVRAASIKLVRRSSTPLSASEFPHMTAPATRGVHLIAALSCGQPMSSAPLLARLT